ncbi:uncharacterized protein B4U79_13351 [Dinothrombium tinctorium]|nr:uncharacterized protein B4U79_13351 [Dinothrombium tinctorium]
MKRRLGFGMREVSKDVELGRVQCLIVAPDVAKFNVLDRTIEKLLESCKEHETPVVFALSRFHLGKVCKKRGYVTCVAVFNYDGSQDNFKKLMERVKEARLKYDEIISTAKEQLNSMDETELSNLADLFASECIIPPICQKMQRELIPSNKDYYSSCRIFPQKTNSSTSTDVKKVSRS